MRFSGFRRAGIAAAVALALGVAASGTAQADGLLAKYGDLDNDGNVDLISVSATGDVLLWAGTAAGGVAAPRTEPNALVDAGELVFGAGDFNRGAPQDVAVFANGCPYIQYGDNAGGFSQSQMAVVSAPPTGLTAWPALTQLVSAGDISGHNRSDLLGKVGDQVFMFPDFAIAHFGAPVAVAGSGWTHRTMVGVTDLTGDGIADLVARDDASGVIWLYPGAAGGTFGDETTRVEVGHGLKAKKYPFVITKGDADGDGVADIWAVGAKGKLFLLAGTASGEFGAPKVVSTDPAWQGVKALG